MRERHPGVWEVRVVVANDPVTGRSVQRSFTVHGNAEQVEGHRRNFVECLGVDRSALYREGARWTRAPRTVRRSQRALAASNPVLTHLDGPVPDRRPDREAGPGRALARPCRGNDVQVRSEGASPALVWARWAVLRSALSWAAARGVVRSNPLEVMRGPPRPLPRKHLLPAEVDALLATASRQVAQAAADLRAKPRDGRLLEALFVAEQTRLLVRLAADTGARRGELAVLRLSDLDGRVLSIERNLSLEVLGPTRRAGTAGSRSVPPRPR